MALSPGSRLGPYEIVAPIGAGGMGEVWRARDTRLERSVAVKVLPDGFGSDTQLKLRFEREAKAISQLSHPNICQLYDVGDNYLVMELLEGESLADRIAKGPLTLDQVLRYGIEICDALDRAHRSGIVHRDLKPGNVMITKSGAKLLDFGLAAIQQQAPAATPHDATAARPLTQEGMIVGTFQYMAPEQLEGLPADSRTDIFALGCVLYEMLTGQRAFEGKNRTSLIAAIVGSNPRPISELQPLTPPALEHIVRRCLAKDPDDRWQSAHDVAEDLKWIRDSGSQAGIAPAVTQRRKTRERLLAGLAIAAVAALFAGGVYVAKHRAAPIALHFTLPGMTDAYFGVSWVRVSPDGTMFLFSAYSRKTGETQLFVRRLDEFDAKPIAGTEEVRSTTWSPDSRSIAFTAGTRLMRVDLGGGAPHLLASVNQATGVAWSGDTIIWGEDEGPIHAIPAAGGAVRTLTKPDHGRHELGHTIPKFLPDGKHFLFISYTRDTTSPDRAHTLYAGSLDGSPPVRIGSISSKAEYSDGSIYFVRDGTLYAQPFDDKALKFTGEAKPVLDNVVYFQPTGSAAFAVDAGMITAVDYVRAGRLVMTDLAGREISTIIAEENFYDRVAVSPDGTKAYVAVVDPKIGTPDIWEYGITRPSKTRITFDPEEEAEPVLAPDGRHLYYGTDRLGVPDVFEKTLGAATPDVPVVVAPNEQQPGSVSPDGRYLLYYTNENGARTKRDIYMVPLAGERKPVPVVVTPANEKVPLFSPDGKWFTYMSDASGQWEIYVRRFPDATESMQVSTAGATTAARWSRDGRRIYFAKDRTLYEVEISPAGELSQPHVLFAGPDLIVTFELMPDGKRFLVAYWSEVGASPPVRVISRWSR